MELVLSEPRRNRSRSQRVRWTVVLRVVLAVGVVMLLVATGTTLAAWTDATAVTGTTFSSGTIDLKVNGRDTVSDFVGLSATSMVPGASTAGVLVVQNSGTVPFVYTMRSSATNPDAKGLGAALTYAVTLGPPTGPGLAQTCGGTALATGNLGGAMVSTGRLLAPGATETVCVQIRLPDTAASSLQGATTDVTLTFDATSVVR